MRLHVLQKISSFWTVGKIFRPTFLVLDSLQECPEYQSYFSANYAPVPYEISPHEDLTKLSGLSLKHENEAVSAMESLYFYHAASPRLPR
jgi:hypothetical protein